MYDVAIIGGGIIGMMSAYELNRAGLKTIIIDKNKLGHGASIAGGGILSSLHPWRDSPAYQDFCYQNQQYYPEIIEALISSTGIDPEYIVSGLLVLKPQNEADFSAWYENNTDKGEMILADQVSAFANVKEQLNHAFWMKQVAQVRNPRLIEALSTYLKTAGVTIMEGQAITKLENTDNSVSSIYTDKEKIQAGHYILAAGAWSGEQIFNTGLAVKPIRGQMLCYQLSERLLDKMVLLDGRYLIPRQDKILLVGSTVEDDGFNCITTEKAKEELHQFAISVLPELRTVTPYTQWAGLRPKINDGMPCINQHPDIGNLYMNFGHFRNGLLTAPISAKMVKNLILQNAT